MALGDVLDIVVLAGVGYFAYSFFQSPLGDALADVGDFAANLVNQNVTAVSELSKGNTTSAYEANCRAGFNPYRPDCAVYTAVKSTIDVGAGVFPDFQGCPTGMTDFGLTCSSWTQTIAKSSSCASDRENVDGLCYKKCPSSHPNRVAGMPYLCKN